MSDKNIEKNRYDRRAVQVLNWGKYSQSINEPLYLQPPIDSYRRLLSSLDKGSRVLEIGAGMGEHTIGLLDNGLNVCSTDISANSVRVMRQRFAKYENFSSQVADMESLPFPDGSFDVVCSAGSLSYGDNLIVRDEIYRVLQKGGVFICVDSLNHNLIYKLNRYIHFLRGNRSKSTLQRMPTQALIDSYDYKFGFTDVLYFGSLIWITPILKLIVGDQIIKTIFSRVDSLFRIQKSAFKFTMKAIKL